MAVWGGVQPPSYFRPGDRAWPMDPGTVTFVQQALALKDQARRGWLRAGVGRPESVADHTWGVALLALAVADARPDLDRARLLELALLHDLPEAITGDLVPGEYASKGEKTMRERDALEGMIAPLPVALRARLMARFEELATDASPEARLIHELDKLEMAFQAERYERQGIASGKLDEFRASAAEGIRDAGLRDTVERLR